ncbi:hypothetical protein M9H77_12473 [Catharanthus roseus]|uniref:Uncharacterized protein n=1 Tax=Catharanthus roseus TaxID=4058 RepID=A0ACC0BHG4_CATRO|nr:hypothetical protein M9H77_12473 [Catharanthus roseus]
MGAQPIKTWSLMKQTLRDRFGVGNHKGQDKVKQRKIMESSKGEKSTKNSISILELLYYNLWNKTKSWDEKESTIKELSINHALRFGEVKRMEYFKYIHFKNHNALATNNKEFGKIRFVFDLGGWGRTLTKLRPQNSATQTRRPRIN